MTEPTSNLITVLLVDDHTMVRQGVRAFLETQPDVEVVGEACNGMEAVALCDELCPQIVLMDLVMPLMDGVEATRRIKAKHSSTQVIILTSFLEDEHLVPAVRSGALSYLLKDVGALELVDAVRKAARGEAVLHPQVTKLVLQTLRGDAQHERDPLRELSERETEVLRLVANGLNNAEIAGQLFISEKTVKSHVSNVLSKLNLTDRTQAAVFAWRSGFMQDK